MDIDDILDDLLKPDNINAQKEIFKSDYEEKIVKRLMTKANLSSEIPTLRYLAKEKTGKNKLLFSWFFSKYPSFPVWLGMRRLPYVQDMEMSDFWNRFTTTRIYTSWQDISEEAPEGMPVGLVFNWPKIRGGPMICHNYVLDLDTSVTWLIRKVGNKVGETFFIGHFDAFVDCVLTRWSGT